MAPIVWIHLPEGEAAKRVLTTALERDITTFILPPNATEDLTNLGSFDTLHLDEGTYTTVDGGRAGERVEIASGDDQDTAFDLVGDVENLVVSGSDWKIIPIENLIAEAQGTTTKLLGEVRSAEEAKLVLETLDVGTDGVVLRTDDPDEVLQLAAYLSSRQGPTLELTHATVRDVRPVGSGDRVCVDTASLLVPGEGMLLGSTSSALFLVHSESLESDYVASRPFRVNAGPVHAYLLGPDGRTRYLSELESGDEVLVVDEDGRTRTVVLGRVKIERRPLLLVEAQAQDRTFTTLLQNAETIRLVTPDGPKSVVDLEPGDEVLVRLEEGGRHFGRSVDESIREV